MPASAWRQDNSEYIYISILYTWPMRAWPVGGVSSIEQPTSVFTRAGSLLTWNVLAIKGVHKREENLGLAVEWRVPMRPGRRRMLDHGSDEALAENAKASVRAKVEHPFLRLKRLFRYGKVRYRELMKNAQRLALLFGLGNLLTAEGQLRG